MTSDPKHAMTRRELISGSVAVAGVALASQLGNSALAGEVATAVTSANESSAKMVKTYSNGDFYNAAGEFQPEKAKEAYFEMFNRFHNPISETLRKGIWVLDFHLDDFAHVGMAGIFWINRQEFGYFGHEIYLLPGQMIPEHKHLPTDKGPAKMESWQPRHGMIYTFGEGEPTPEFFSKIPASQRDIVKSRHCKPLAIDETADLNRHQAWHFMVAGPKGVVTEYGTFHDMGGLRFSNPKAKV